MADPWPEPDEVTSPAPDEPDQPVGDFEPEREEDRSAEDNEAKKAADDADAGALAPPEALEDDDDTSYDVSDASNAVAQQIYCSAPGPDGMVTVVAMAGSVLVDADIIIQRRDIQHVLRPSPDGGFFDRIPADPGETLTVIIRERDSGMETQLDVVTGTRDGEYVSDEILGRGTISLPDEENQVVVLGSGTRLADGDLVVGGNLQRNTGRAAAVSCDETGCTFELSIPAESDDYIDLFLVPLGTYTGRTDVQTVVVP